MAKITIETQVSNPKTKRLIVCSSINSASKNIFNILTRELDFKPTKHKFESDFIYENKESKHLEKYQLINIKKGVLDIEYLNKTFSPEIYIVASAHKSEKPYKTLTCHTPGNYGKAMLGGKDDEIAIAPARFLTATLKQLKTHSNKDYDVCFEVTHHGPSKMNAPIMFVEVGSQEDEWNDLDACRTVCNAILAQPTNLPSAIAFGSMHYSHNFSKEYVVNKFAIGHICPKYHIESLDENMIRQMIDNTHPTPRLAIIDRKGVSGPQYAKLKKLLEKLDFKWIKLNELKTKQ